LLGQGQGGLKRLTTVALALGSVLACAFSAGGASAQDFRFGPVGEGPGTRTFEREFIREWEANPEKGLPTLSRANIEPTKAAIKRYTDIVAAGGWRPVPNVKMQNGMNHPAVAALRARLLASGDLRDASSTSTSFDYYVDKAVQRFQESNGLSPTGVVDEHTIAALNVPAAARLKQLRANLARLNELKPPAKARKYVVVNIPAAQIEAIEHGKVAQRYAGVVGKIDRPTPILRSSISQLNFNPMWTLPPTVIDEDLIPKGRQMQKDGQSVLVKFGIDAYDSSGRKLDPTKINWSSRMAAGLSYRQKPGKGNPLGFLKINFDNAHAVYMHDTPSESIFGRNFRAASSGCIRVLKIENLAVWILEDQGWNIDNVEKLKENGKRLDVRVKKPIPLYFVYITAWATPDGTVQFRRDLYQRDGIGSIAANY
jgi:murein L,D-transpeptidase YcbB/YkuD